MTPEKIMLKNLCVKTDNLSQTAPPFTNLIRLFDLEMFLKYCETSNIEEIERLLLVSDGSMTRMLNSLFLSEVIFQVKNQEIEPLDAEMAEYLDTSPNQPAINRVVWLGCKNHNKLIYAFSVILTSSINKNLYKDVVFKKSPLGILMSKYKIPVLRSKLFIGLIKSEQIASELGLDKNHTFWARIYQLSAKDDLTAAIFEVFSPEIIKA